MTTRCGQTLRNRVRATWGVVTAACLFCLSNIGCLPMAALESNQQNSTRTCTMGADQQAAFNGRWPRPGVPVAVQTNGFNDYERGEIAAAIRTWNQHSGSVFRYNILDGGSAGIYIASRQSNTQICDVPVVSNGSFVYPVIISKIGAWTRSSSEIATTTSCKTSNYDYAPGGALPAFIAAGIDLNYQHYFVTNQRPDLQSIILHELGHLIGLDHSCGGSGEIGLPPCNAGTINPLYLSAVMFPGSGINSSTGVGIPRRALNANDQGRFNCLQTL